MKLVFLVTRGEYSDYGVIAVFSTRKKAEEYVINYNACKKWGDDAEIDEREMDGSTKSITYIQVDMLKDGTVYRVNKVTKMLEIGEEMGYGGVWDPTMHCCKNHDSNALTWRVQTDSGEKAIKVVAERRAELLALGIWGDREKVDALYSRKKP